MKKWEYRIIRIGVCGDREGAFDELGAEGWELVAVDHDEYYFKRPVKK